MEAIGSAVAGYLDVVVLSTPPPPWEDPSLFAQQVLSGIASGSLFAILALAVVLIYRSTDVLNFGQGEMAMFTTFIAWSFMTQMPLWPAFFLTLLVAAAMGAALERLVLRPVEEAPVLNAVIVTLGLYTIFTGLALRVWGPLPKGFGPFTLDFLFFEIDLAGPVCAGEVCIGKLSVATFVAAVIIMALLFVLFQKTMLGLAMRATAQNRTASRLVGIPVGRMLSVGWGLSAAVGAVAGVFVAQNVGLSTGSLAAILIFAFAAAVLGGLDSPVGAIVGGLTIGVVRNLAGTYVPSEVGSVDLVVAFLLIVLVLMVRPTGIFGRRALRRV
ncbi:MAG: branched-chain amino acid ABC transporter permease [Chloroflexi bacterium]|nr:branched-chain amino acid ABC transporter permease [Chloroflexota bacterium]